MIKGIRIGFIPTRIISRSIPFSGGKYYLVSSGTEFSWKTKSEIVETDIIYLDGYIEPSLYYVELQYIQDSNYKSKIIHLNIYKNTEDSCLAYYEYIVREFMNCAIPEDFRSETSLAKESVEFIINLYAKILSSLYKSVEDIRDEQNLGRVSKEKVLLIADLLGISMLDSQFLGSDLRKILTKVPIIHKFRGAETALKATNLLETNIQPFIDYENGEIHVILQINESTDTRLFQNITPAGWKIGYTQVGNINKSQLIYTYVGSSEDIIGYTMLYKPQVGNYLGRFYNDDVIDEYSSNIVLKNSSKILINQGMFAIVKQEIKTLYTITCSSSKLCGVWLVGEQEYGS